jgi:hypothetical protein
MDTSTAAAALAELFTAPRAEFVAVRDRLAKQARGEDAELAERLAGLRKPTVAAWLANQISRRHPADVARLAELGEQLRESHRALAGDRLRELSQQRHDLLGRLTELAEAVADGAAQSIGSSTAEALEATWTAALSSADAAEALRAGTLSGPLTDSTEDWLVAAAASPPPRSRPRPAARPADRKRDRAAERERERAEAAAQSARQGRDQAERDHRAAEAAARQAADAVAELTEQLAALRDRLAEARDAERAARGKVAPTREALRRAEQAVRAAESRLEA